MLHNNGHTAYANGTGPGIRETGVVEKLLTSYGFIQCSERQARLFFHCSQYNGNLQELKIGGEEQSSVTHSNLSFLDLNRTSSSWFSSQLCVSLESFTDCCVAETMCFLISQMSFQFPNLSSS